MRNALIAAATPALVALDSAAHANASAHEVDFECRVVRTVPAEKNDSDPVLRTALMFTFNRDRIIEFSVEHITLRGAIHARHQQYGQRRVWQERDSFHWIGRLMSDPRVMMIGSMVQLSGRNLALTHYIEQRYRDGRVETTKTHECEASQMVE